MRTAPVTVILNDLDEYALEVKALVSYTVEENGDLSWAPQKLESVRLIFPGNEYTDITSSIKKDIPAAAKLLHDAVMGSNRAADVYEAIKHTIRDQSEYARVVDRMICSIRYTPAI